MTAPPDLHSSDRLGDIKERAEQATREYSPWIEWLGRFGYAAKGVVYLVVGVLAVQAALGRGGQTTDQQGALTRIAEAPLGGVLLAIVTVGLVGYAVWRCVQGLVDTEDKGSDAKGLFTRSLYVGVGLIYLGLAFSAAQILLGAGGNGGSQQAQDWTARLLGHPLGALVVGLAGLGVIGNAFYQFYKAYSADFRKELRSRDLDADHLRWVARIGRAGYAARGVAFGLIGMGLVAAAVHSNANEARGIDGALATLAEQPFGPWLLGIVAAGLAAYGIFALLEARYRRFDVS